ncbi:MAG: ABC transporter substrate-binding protein [Pseudomonadota bacterium]
MTDHLFTFTTVLARRAWLCVWVFVLGCESPLNEEAPAVGETAQRVVSLDYCADQFVLKFVPRHQIVAVSPDARKHFSYLRNRHPDVPSVRSSAEDVLALSPTTVVRSYGGGPRIGEFLSRAGIEVVQLGYPQDLSQVRTQTLEMATALGQPTAGEREIERFDARLAAIVPAPELSVLYTTPSGVTTGPGSIVHELMVAAGLQNYELNAGWHDLPLERLVYMHPDRLVNATFGDPKSHVNPWSLSRHPHVRSLVTDVPGIHIEGAKTACGGWFLLDAVEAIATLGARH